MNFPLLNVCRYYFPAGRPMTGPEGGCQCWEGRAQPKPVGEGSSLGTAPAEAASSSSSWQRSPSVPGKACLEEVLPHPVNLRAELMGEFGEPQNGVTEGWDCHARGDSRQKGKLLFFSTYYVLGSTHLIRTTTLGDRNYYYSQIQMGSERLNNLLKVIELGREGGGVGS